jgi:inner membrane transporter RhtA
VTANVIGFSLEFAALGRIRPALYGILICLEPAVAAILAVPLLGERLGPVSIAAIGLVTLASIGASRSR